MAIDLRKNEHQSDAFKALNPQGLVPALVDAGHVLTQSVAIIEWLEERYPSPPLLPSDTNDRAQVRALAAIVGCDIHPVNNKRILDTPPLHMGDYQQLLRGEPFRAKFRSSWEKPEALVPGKQTEIDFTMPDLYHTFRRGHRIMIQVQSSWFPLVDRNPQSFTEIPTARPEEFRKATETVFHQKDAASGVEVLVVGNRD